MKMMMMMIVMTTRQKARELRSARDEEEKEEAPNEDTKNKGKYYVLNVADHAVLKNGYRYIKELLLQYHNYRIYKDYNTLRKNDIEVFSVKTDAFTKGYEVTEVR